MLAHRNNSKTRALPLYGDLAAPFISRGNKSAQAGWSLSLAEKRKRTDGMEDDGVILARRLLLRVLGSRIALVARVTMH